MKFFSSPVIDFDINPKHPWVSVSASENPESDFSGGGILQTFKPLDLLCMDPKDAEDLIASMEAVNGEEEDRKGSLAVEKLDEVIDGSMVLEDDQELN